MHFRFLDAVSSIHVLASAEIHSNLKKETVANTYIYK